MYERPNFDRYYIEIAKSVSARATCLRRRYGAVLVKDNKIVATGYNGSAAGEVNCTDCKNCLRQELGVESGTRYELCRSVHAEANALLNASREESTGATLYISGFNVDDESVANAEPCMMCERLIKNSKIEKIVITNNKDEIQIIYVKDLKKSI